MEESLAPADLDETCSSGVNNRATASTRPAAIVRVASERRPYFARRLMEET
jgi:hypothetical protein